MTEEQGYYITLSDVTYDNKPIDSRTGINSDPNNPNGVARPTTDVKGN